MSFDRLIIRLDALEKVISEFKYILIEILKLNINIKKRVKKKTHRTSKTINKWSHTCNWSPNIRRETDKRVVETFEKIIGENFTQLIKDKI